MTVNNKTSIVFFLFVLFCLVLTAQAQQGQTVTKYFNWSHGQEMRRPVENPNAKKLSLIKVKGNRFVNALGDTILFRGTAIADPDKLEQGKHWDKKIFLRVKEFGATLVRIPVHPVPWRMRTPAKYLQLLDQAVDWCTELGMYVIIDWHSIGNLGMELFQDPMYYTTRQETYEFWRTIAMHFRGNNTVAFYELFNEPTLHSGKLGSMSWSEWKKINENIIHLIRAYDTERIPLVAGLDWAYNLTPLHIEPIEAEGIGYVTHPYAHKCKRPYGPKWDEAFGFASNRYPVVATEFGFTIGTREREDTGEYGKEIISYLEERGMSWVCWVFDPEWQPGLVESWAPFILTKSGKFFKQALQQKIPK
jgi:aryl-phospho-beta-D-glucosidase BglC (GH1 family)